MYICNKCGDLIEELPTTTETEECWGRVVTWQEPYNDCDCGGKYVDAVKCVHCGEYIPCDMEHKKELEKEFDNISDDYRKEHFEPNEQWAEANEFCEDCLNQIIKEYKEWEKQK